MAGPDPVVGVASELADRRGRCGHEAHVVELLVDEEELLVAVIHLFDGGLVPDAFGLGACDDLCGALAGGDAVGDLLHADQEADVETLVRELFGARAGPETVGEIVVLDGRMALDGVVTAVVVRQQQPFRGDEFSGAASSEEHHGILHRGAVDRIDIFSREAETFGTHVVDAFGDEAREPHALVGCGGPEPEEGEESQ